MQNLAPVLGLSLVCFGLQPDAAQEKIKQPENFLTNPRSLVARLLRATAFSKLPLLLGSFWFVGHRRSMFD